MLADKIIQERKKKGWSQEELAERLEVSRQSVSKWEGGLSVPELDKIIAMSTLFGVSTDYLLKDDGEVTPRETPDTAEAPTPSRVVTVGEAKEYVSLVKKLSWYIAVGVGLCILSPILLIQLAVLAEQGLLAEGLAAALGLGGLFAFVGAALALFIPSGCRLSPYEYLEKEPFEAETGVIEAARREKAAYAGRFRAGVTTGVLLILSGVANLVVWACLPWVSEILVVGCVNILLALVAFGVFLMVRVCYINGAYEKLLQTGEFAREKKTHSPLKDAVLAAYWCGVTGLYLLLSFLTDAWHLTWIVWVVAALAESFIELAFAKRKNP